MAEHYNYKRLERILNHAERNSSFMKHLSYHLPKNKEIARELIELGIKQLHNGHSGSLRLASTVYRIIEESKSEELRDKYGQAVKEIIAKDCPALWDWWVYQ